MELKDGRVAKALELCKNNTKLMEDVKESLNLFFIDSMANTPTISISAPFFQKLLDIFFRLDKQLTTTRENLESSAKELTDTCTNFEFIGNWITQVRGNPLIVQPRELDAQSRNLEFLQSLLQNYTAIFDKEQKTLTDLRKNIFSSVNSVVQGFFSEQQNLATQILLSQNNFINYLLDFFAESELKDDIISVRKSYSHYQILKMLSDEINGKVFEFSTIEDFETKFKARLSLIHNIYLDVETIYSDLAEPTKEACKSFLKRSVEKESDFSNLVPILDSLVDSEPDAYKRLIGDLIANKNSNEARDLLNKLARPQILFGLGCFNPLDKKLNGIYAAINEVLDELAQEPRATTDPNPTNISQEQGSDEQKITGTEKNPGVSSEDQTIVSQKQPK